MIIKVSKVFAKFINETANKEGFKANAIYSELSPLAYSHYVGDRLINIADYNSKTGKYKVIRVEYPAEYYCSPVFLTTVHLNREFNRNAVETVDDLRNMLRDMLEV